MDQQREEHLWELINIARGQGNMGLLPMVLNLLEQGETFDTEDLLYLQQRLGEGGVDASVGQFLRLLLKTRRSKRILHCARDLDLLGAWIAHQEPDWSVDVVSPVVDAAALAKQLGLKRVTFHEESREQEHGSLTATYDAIVLTGSVARRRVNRTYPTEAGTVALHDDPASLMIVDTFNRLTAEGVIVALVSPGFAFETRTRSVRANLGQFGLHLSAILALRPGTFGHTGVALNLVLVDRKARKKLFVAEVPEDIEGQRALIDRFHKGRQGRTASQGRMVDPAGFHGLAPLEARERYDKLGKKADLSPVAFDIAVAAIRRPRRAASEFERCEEHAHAVYLPEMATTPATTMQDELPAKLKSYFQLLVDPAVVLPEYLAGWLNSPIGYALRQLAMTGATIPRIKRDLLAESRLYLPSIEEQMVAIKAVREIRSMRSELAELESRIWDRPRAASDVSEAVGRVNREDRFSDWTETLPFPLASILRAYHAVDRTPNEKYERLLYFFEAFAEFWATIHLSAVRTRAPKWLAAKEKLVTLLRRNNLSLERSTFGTWKAISETLGADLRRMLKDNARAEAKVMYAVASDQPLEMLASGDVLGVLQRVNGFRNRWKGHGGVVTESQAQERHETIGNDLARLRSNLGFGFSQYQLVEANESAVLDGPVFRCSVRQIVGSNPQFEHDQIDLVTPAKTGYLYFHNPGHTEALELLPLVQLQGKPQAASYFYNRVERSTPQLVSYHFAEHSEISSHSVTLRDLLRDLSGGLTLPPKTSPV